MKRKNEKKKKRPDQVGINGPAHTARGVCGAVHALTWSERVLLPGARAPPITRFTEGIISWALFPGPLFCSYFSSVWNKPFPFWARAQEGRPFSVSSGSFNFLVRCIGPPGYINWCNFS
jgi:hypothetical protein